MKRSLAVAPKLTVIVLAVATALTTPFPDLEALSCELTDYYARDPLIFQTPGCRREKTLAPHPPHSLLHVLDLLLARAHEREDRLPFKRADVLWVGLVITIEVHHHVVKFGRVLFAEFAEDEQAA